MKKVYLIATLSVLALFSAPLMIPALSAGTVRVELGGYPINVPLVVDGVVYTPPHSGSRIVLYWEEGTQHTVSVLEKHYYTGPGERLTFTGWNRGSGDSIMVTANDNMTILALYVTELYLQVYSPYGTPQGSGWYVEGSRVNVSVEKIVPLSDGVRAVFTGWSAGMIPSSSTENYLYMLEPTIVKAQWKIEYRLEIDTGESNASVEGEGWYQAGTTARVKAGSEMLVDDGKTMYKFHEWRVLSGAIVLDDPASTVQLIEMNGPVTLSADYDVYYLVNIVSSFGEPVGGGYVKSGDTVQVGIKNPIVQISDNTRYVLAGWSNGEMKPTFALKVDAPITVEAVWKPQYKVTVQSKGGPQVEGTGWYYEGETVELRAPAVAPGKGGVKYIFSGWQGDASGSEPILTLSVRGPMEVYASWEKSYTQLYADLFIVSLVSSLAIAASLKLIRPRIERGRETITEQSNEE
ncbi:MAG: hypothetical protein F7C35_07215 [Desulfurococcales archaeon]|nr:hypothetical protein [Desulfurococcales archaeon]